MTSSPPSPSPSVYPIYPDAASLPLDPIMPKKKHPIAICGAGAIVSSAHLPAYRMCNFTILGIYDVNQKQAYDVAKQFNIPKIYTSMKEMVENVPKDVIYDIAVPASAIVTTLQYLPDKAAVLIQKPMGGTWEQTLAIQHICKEKQLIASINFQLRYSPHMLITHALIQQGILGYIHNIRFDIHTLQPWENWPFLERSRVEILYHSIHYIDALRSIWGTPTGIYAISTPDPILPRIHTSRSDILFSYKPIISSSSSSSSSSSTTTTTSTTSSNLYDYHHPNPSIPTIANDTYLDKIFNNNIINKYYSFNYPHRHASIHSHHSDRTDSSHRRSNIVIEGTKGTIECVMGLNLNYPDDLPSSNSVRLYLTSTKTWYDIPLHGRVWMPHAFRGPMCDLQRYVEGSISTLPTHYSDAFETMCCVETAYQSIENVPNNVEPFLNAKL